MVRFGIGLWELVFVDGIGGEFLDNGFRWFCWFGGWGRKELCFFVFFG